MEELLEQVGDENSDQFAAFSENRSEGPVVLLNLLKFKAEGGVASYLRYGMAVDELVKEIGGKYTFMGRPKELLIGHETWDAVVLLRYPNRKSFVAMVNDPRYLEIVKYRTAGLDRCVLYAVDEMGPQELLFGEK
jgi:uncharacterized protein (DUF1330 family)